MMRYFLLAPLQHLLKVTAVVMAGTEEVTVEMVEMVVATVVMEVTVEEMAAMEVMPVTQAMVATAEPQHVFR
ncbi:MAG: hypothetical protein AAB517_02530 [Patescibacteria group bacterium]